MQIISKEQFKKMPWKNGGGETLEIYRIPNQNNAEDFILRFSKANVNSSGPFSEFININRILLLLSGNGFLITNESGDIKKIDTPLIPTHFKGESKIVCNLINGPCVDFNIMYDRRFLSGVVTVASECNAVTTSYLYDLKLEKFIILNAGEKYHGNNSFLIIFTTTNK